MFHLQRIGNKDFTEVLSLEQAKEHLRVLHNDDDEYIESCIQAAGVHCESFLGYYINSQCKFTTTGWPSGQVLSIYGGHTDGIVIKYMDNNWAEQTLDGSKYRFVAATPIQVYLIEKPILGSGVNNVNITFTTSIPEDVLTSIRHAMKLLVAAMYEVRQPEITGTVMARSQIMTVENLLLPHKIYVPCQ